MINTLLGGVSVQREDHWSDLTSQNFLKFVIADGLAALVSGGLFVALGVWFGNNLDTVKAKMHEFKVGLAIFGVVAAIALVAYIIWRKKTHKTPTQAVLDKAIEKDLIHVDHDPVADQEKAEPEKTA